MHYYGAVYRPPSEAYSLIVQCTLGCSHNKCAFCNMYKDKKFSIRPVEEVLRDLAEARSYERRIERIFLADGDALILPMDYLLQVLDFIREYFPECTRVAAYATTKAIERKTDEELRKLREHGLALVYIGLESGNEELLLKFNKGVTAAETVKNALRCKAAGIAISVTAINGMAGLNGDWQAHAIDTAKAVSAMKPEFIAFLTLRVYSGTPLHDWIEAGEFQMMGPGLRRRSDARDAALPGTHRLRGQRVPFEPRLKLPSPRRHAQPRPRGADPDHRRRAGRQGAPAPRRRAGAVTHLLHCCMKKHRACQVQVLRFTIVEFPPASAL